MNQDVLAAVAQLLGAGTLGALLLKVVERIFARADKGDDLAVGLRAEMIRRLETLEHQYASLELRERQSYQKAVRLDAENRALRNRYHALVNWIATQPGLPTPPQWLYEQVEGPTAGAAGRPEDQP